MGNAYWQDQSSPAFWGDNDDKQSKKGVGTYKINKQKEPSVPSNSYIHNGQGGDNDNGANGSFRTNNSKFVGEGYKGQNIV